MTKADKCGAVDLNINVDDYMKEGKRQLDNTELYTKLNVNPTAIPNDIVNKAIRDLSYLNTCQSSRRRQSEDCTFLPTTKGTQN